MKLIGSACLTGWGAPRICLSPSPKLHNYKCATMPVLKILCVYVCVSMWIGECSSIRGQKRASDPLGLELQVVMS